jgi:hypothetical protein
MASGSLFNILERYFAQVMGHGFKFASVVGEIMSDLAIKGSTSLPIGFLNSKGFEN